MSRRKRSERRGDRPDGGLATAPATAPRPTAPSPPTVERSAAGPGGPDRWKVPPLPVLLTAVALIAAAEVGGASMARFKLELARWVRGVMLARPSVHGFVGVRDVDEQVLDEALVKFDAGLRLFHMHAEGMGLVILGTTMVAATLVAGGLARRVIVLLLTAGGAGYPFGYLAWSALIPFWGIERGKAVAEWLFWIPFGGATIVATWWLAVVVALRMVRR